MNELSQTRHRENELEAIKQENKIKKVVDKQRKM